MKYKFNRYKERQEQAAVRQAEYDKLTVKQKLAKLDKGGFTATKQRKKLMSGDA